MKSSIALPSLRNSGLLTMSKGTSTPRRASSSRMTARTLSPVPTGTVDLFTTIVKLVISRPMSRATSSTYCRSAEPSSPGGVPTAMKTISERSTASAMLVVKRRRSSRALRLTISSRPGS